MVFADFGFWLQLRWLCTFLFEQLVLHFGTVFFRSLTAVIFVIVQETINPAVGQLFMLKILITFQSMHSIFITSSHLIVLLFACIFYIRYLGAGFV